LVGIITANRKNSQGRGEREGGSIPKIFSPSEGLLTLMAMKLPYLKHLKACAWERGEKRGEVHARRGEGGTISKPLDKKAAKKDR